MKQWLHISRGTCVRNRINLSPGNYKEPYIKAQQGSFTVPGVLTRFILALRLDPAAVVAMGASVALGPYFQSVWSSMVQTVEFAKRRNMDPQAESSS